MTYVSEQQDAANASMLRNQERAGIREPGSTIMQRSLARRAE